MVKRTQTITLTTDIECPEGNLTDRSMETMHELMYYGGMWATDVIGDWHGILGCYLADAQVVYEAERAARNPKYAYTADQFYKWAYATGVADPEDAADDYRNFSNNAVGEDFVEAVREIVQSKEISRQLCKAKIAEDVEKFVKILCEDITNNDCVDVDPNKSYENEVHRQVALEMYRQGQLAEQRKNLGIS